MRRYSPVQVLLLSGAVAVGPVAERVQEAWNISLRETPYFMEKRKIFCGPDYYEFDPEAVARKELSHLWWHRESYLERPLIQRLAQLNSVHIDHQCADIDLHANGLGNWLFGERYAPRTLPTV